MLKQLLILLFLMLFLNKATAQELKPDIIFHGQINFITVNYLMNQIKAQHEEKPINEQIMIEINSPGGSVNAGFGLIKYINHLKENHRLISFKVKGICASMCFTVLQTGFRRYITEDSKLMQHSPYTYIQIPVKTSGIDYIKLMEQEIKIKKHLDIIKRRMENIELYRLNLDRTSLIKKKVKNISKIIKELKNLK